MSVHFSVNFDQTILTTTLHKHSQVFLSTSSAYLKNIHQSKQITIKLQTRVKLTLYDQLDFSISPRFFDIIMTVWGWNTT